MKKVIIVEDDPVVALVYRIGLEKEGFHVQVKPQIIIEALKNAGCFAKEG